MHDENLSDQDPNHSKFYAFKIAFVAAVGGFLFGYDLGLIGAANPYLKDQFNLNEMQLGFVTSSAVLGCVFGPFLGVWLCDALGRKKSMIIASFLLAISAIVTAIAKDMVIFNTFRFVGGLGIGLCSIASPMYIAEVAPKHKRGAMGLMYQLAIVVGSIIAPFCAWLIVLAVPQETLTWRWMFASETVFVLLFVAFVLTLPPSPRWLARKGKYKEALKIMEKVESEEYAHEEMEVIRNSLTQESGSITELFKPGIRYALVIGILLAFFNNWTGWSAMGGYIPILFEKSGLNDRSVAILQFAMTYLFMGLMTLVSLFLMDRVGRRPLWIFASFMMAIITAATGLVFHFNQSGLIVLLVIMLCTVPHGIALGGIPWLMMSELFPTKIRAKAVSVTTTVLWIAGFVGAQLFPIITGISERLLGSVGGAFWLFSFISILSFLFGIKYLPETKGRTLEEIATSWKK